MKIQVKGNTNKQDMTKALRKVKNGEREDSVLSFWVAKNIKKRDGSERTVWSKVTVWRGYAETIARLLGNQSRKVMVTGTCEAKTYTNKENRIIPYIDIQADEVEFLDDKWPEGETPLDNVDAPDPEPTTEDTPF